MNRAWDLAGLTTTCKAVRKGFDSLPRLHSDYLRRLGAWRFKRGQALAQWILNIEGSAFAQGVQYGAFLREQKRNYPARRPLGERVYNLMIEKHLKLVSVSTDLYELKQKHIVMSKELSALKRGKKPT